MAREDWVDADEALDEFADIFKGHCTKTKRLQRQLLDTAAAKKLVELENNDLKERITNGVSSGAIMCGNCKLQKNDAFGWTFDQMAAATSQKIATGAAQGLV